MKKVPAFKLLKNHSRLSRYRPLVSKFLDYLHDKEHTSILIEGFDTNQSDFVYVVKPYMHRWKPGYMKSRLAMLYLLEKWCKTNPMPLSMLTFTTYHDSDYARKKIGQGFSIEQSWNILKDGFRRASMLIRNKIRSGVSYMWIVEPQIESGYPHIHAGYFTEFSDEEKERLKTHWANVVKAGDYKHGLDFSFGLDYQSGDISSMRNYLMKYLGKTFIDGMTEWTPEELVFNAVAWNGGYRFFGCSRDLSQVMKRIEQENEGYLWLSTTLHNDDRGYEEDRIIWKNHLFK